MPSRQRMPPALDGLLRAQSGVVTFGQLVDSGLSHRVVARMARDWQRVSSGIYLVGQPTWEGAAWSGILKGGEGAVLFGASAAYLHGAVRDPPAELNVIGPRPRSAITVGPCRVVFLRGTRRGRGSPPRTAVEPSVLDLATRSDEETALSAVARVLARGLSTAPRFLTELRSRGRQRHRKALEDLLVAGGDGIESGLEWLFHRDVIRPHGLPVPRRQVRTHAGRVDNLFAEQAVIVELDGIRDHTDWSKDMFRDNEHAHRLQILTLRYGWHAVSGMPCAVADQLARCLTRRGWHGKPRRCPSCREE